MDMIQIIGIGISGTVAAIILKEYKPAYALCVAAITATVIFFLMLSEISYIFEVIRTISGRIDLDGHYIGTIIRIIGIAYVAQFGTEICRDAGQNTIAQKIELAGKILIVTASIPLLTAVLNLLIGILPA